MHQDITIPRTLKVVCLLKALLSTIYSIITKSFLFLQPIVLFTSCLDCVVVFVARAPPTTTTPLTTPTTTSTTLLTYKVHLQEKQQGKKMLIVCTPYCYQ